MSKLIELCGIKKTYDMGEIQVHALRGVDLEISSGEAVAIMGASGSGKSTLMNILGCLDTPSGGSYLLDGQQVARLDEEDLAHCRRTKLGFVFQNFNLLRSSTPLENVELPMVYMGITRRERQKRAREALAIVGLGDRMDHKPWQLSGGQQQRVALARALANSPPIILADEPTGNLDSQTSEEMVELLLRLHHDHNLSLVVVTHDPDIAAYLHRVVIMYDGRVVYDRPGPMHGGPPIPHIKTLASTLNLQPSTDTTGDPLSFPTGKNGGAP